MLARAHEEDLRVATAMSLVEPTPAPRYGQGGDDAVEEARLQEVLELSRREAEEDARARHQVTSPRGRDGSGAPTSAVRAA